MMKAHVLICALCCAAACLFFPGGSIAKAEELSVRVLRIPVPDSMVDDARVIALARARRELLDQVGLELALVPAVKEARLSRDDILALAAALVSPHVISLAAEKDARRQERDLAFAADLDNTAIHSQARELMADEDRLARYKSALDFEKTLMEQAGRILARLDGHDADRKEAARELHAQARRVAAISLTHMANDAFLKSPRNMDKAWEYYTGAIRLDPDCAPAYANRAVWLLTSSNFQKAVEDLTWAIALMPDNGAAWQDRGVAFAELGRPDLAVSDFSRAIELNPEKAGAYAARGYARMVIGDKTGGCADFAAACRLGQCSGLKDARKKDLCP